MIDLKTLVKDNAVHFARYRKGHLYYTIGHWVTSERFDTYEFPVPIEDVGDATFNQHEKAILFMRYIRKAQEEGSFVRASP